MHEPLVWVWFWWRRYFRVLQGCVFVTQRKFSTLLLCIGYWLNVESRHWCNSFKFYESLHFAPLNSTKSVCVTWRHTNVTWQVTQIYQLSLTEPKITVMKPENFSKCYVRLQLKSPTTKWPYFVPISQVVRPVMLALLMRGCYNEAAWNAVFVLVA